MEQIHEIVVNNRILTKINGKSISVLDVMKQMDVFLSRYYPQYLNSKTARYQFYSSQWRQTLQQMIDHELMVADAEAHDIKISDGDVREKIHTRFGPNVMETLDTLGISYDEAREIIHQDMIVEKIEGFRVVSKTLQKVTSQDIKNSYERFIKENPPKEEWKYQFLTIRNSDQAPEESAAEKTGKKLALSLLDFKDKAQKSLALAADLCKAELPTDSTASFTVSQEFSVEDKALSQSHRDALLQLELGQWSGPITQLSRDGSAVVRIFHLKDHIKTKAPAFTAIANDLKQKLLNATFELEKQSYVAALHKKFNFDEKSLDIPPNFEPFAAR
jgi:hypothetical protein